MQAHRPRDPVMANLVAAEAAKSPLPDSDGEEAEHSEEEAAETQENTEPPAAAAAAEPGS